MTPDDWQRVKEILDGVLGLSDAERPAFLDRACGNDIEMRKEVESLLANEISTHFLERTPAPRYRELSLGESIGSYRVLEEIGRGGMGVVYRVVHTGLGRELALKCLRVSSPFDFGIEAFQREAKVLGGLKHPHIVDVTDFGIEGELPYLVMELVSGSTLRARASRAIPPEEALVIIEALAGAIDYAHSRGVLHGDLKPENVAFADSSAGSSKVLDFGVSRLLTNAAVDEPAGGAGRSSLERGAEPETATLGTIAGTPSYMAPELFRGARPSVSSDIYALAVMAFELLAGRRPFAVPREALSGGFRRGAIPRPSSVNPSLPSEVDAPLMAALSESISERPKNASSLIEGLRTAIEQGHRRMKHQGQRSMRWIASLTLAVAVGVASPMVWEAPWCRSLENRILDAKWSLWKRAPPDPAILVVTVDERWLEATPASLAQQGDIFGRLLSSAFAAGARAIAMDLVLPAAWREAEPFSTLVLTHPDSLTLAAFGSATDGTVRGQECLPPIALSILGRERLDRLFGLVNLEPDDDEVVRRGRWTFMDRDGHEHLTWAARATETFAAVPRQETFLLDQSMEIDKVNRISFDRLSSTLQASPGLFRNKLVIVGATYEGSGDSFRTAGRRDGGHRLPGVFVQANLIHTLLSGVRIDEASPTRVLLTSGLLLVLLSTLVLLPSRPALPVVAPPAILFLYGGASVVAFRWHHLDVPAAGPLLSLAIATVLAWLVRKALA